MVKNLPTVERSTKIRFGKNCTDDQAENTIVFNASNVQIDATIPGAVYMTPLREQPDLFDTNVTMMSYNTNTKELMDTGVTASKVLNLKLEDVTINGNVTSNTMIFRGETAFITESTKTGISNSTPTHTLDVGSNLYIDDTGNTTLNVTGITKTTELEVTGDARVHGNLDVTGVVTSIRTENVVIDDAIIEIANNNTLGTIDMGVIMTKPGTNVGLGYRANEDEFMVGFTQSDADGVDLIPDTSNLIQMKVYGDLDVSNTLHVSTRATVGSNVVIDDVADNVIYVTGNTYTSRAVNVGSNVVIDDLAEDVIVATGNVSVSHALDVGSNVVINDLAEDVIVATGNVAISRGLDIGSNVVIDDLAEDVIVATGNVSVSHALDVGSNVVINDLAEDVIVATGNVSVSRALDVGSNVVINDLAEDVIVATGNVAISRGLDIGSNVVIDDLAEDVIVATGNVSVSHALDVGSNVVINDLAEDVIVTTGNTHTTRKSTIGSNVTIDTLASDKISVQGNIHTSRKLTVGPNVVIDTLLSNVVSVTGGMYASDHIHVGSNVLIDEFSEDVIVATGNVSISRGLDIGSNVVINDLADDVIVATGNVSISRGLDVGSNVVINDLADDVIVATGNVSISRGLDIGSNVVINDVADDAIDVTGNIRVSQTLTSEDVTSNTVHANTYYGDGGILSNVTLQVVSDKGNTTSNTLQFTNSHTAFTTDLTSNVEVKLDQLSNVAITSPQADNVLIYDGSNWVNDYNLHNFIKVHNTTGSTLYRGNTVYIVDSFNNNVANVALAKSDSSSTMPAIGLIHEDIANGEEGTAVAYGKVNGINTTGFVEGQTVYVSNVGAGLVMNSKPYGLTDQIQNVGICIKVHQSNGVIFVTGVGRSNDIPNAPISSSPNYVYVNETNNDMKKIAPSNLLTKLQTLEQVVNTGNTVSNSIEITGNLTVSQNVSIGGITTDHFPIIGNDGYLKASTISLSDGSTLISSNLEVAGDIIVTGNSYVIESNTVIIEDRIIGIAVNNPSHDLDTGIIMEHPGHNIALVHHGDEDRFSIGYTQNTTSDNHVLPDSNIFYLDVLGNVVVQNNMTVGSGGSYFGDGTTLTGVALETDLSDNSARISTISTDLSDNSARISTISTDLSDNSARISTISTDLSDNSSRIGVLELQDLDDIVNIGNSTSNTILLTNTDLGLKADGNIQASYFIGDGSRLDNIASNLEEIVNNGNVASNTILLTNTDLGLKADGNIQANYFIGDGSGLDNIASNLEEIVNNGNVTSNTILLTNADLGLKADGNIQATYFIGDGSRLDNIASNLEEIVNNGNVASNTILLTNADLGLKADGNIQANYFIGDGSGLDNIASNLEEIVNNGNVASNTILLTNTDLGLKADGNIQATYFIGDGSRLDNIASNLEEIVLNGNVTTQTIHIENVVSLTTTGNVGIANTNPTCDLAVGSNVCFNDISSNILTVDGNILAHRITLDSIQIASVYALEYVTQTGNTTSNTVEFTNSVTGLVTTANVGIANSSPIHTLDVGSNLWVDEIGSNVLYVNGNVHVDGSQLTTAGKVGIGNTAPGHELSVGSNLYVEDTGSNVLVVNGNASIGTTLTLGAIEITPAYNLEEVTGEGNVTSNVIQFTNSNVGAIVTGGLVVNDGSYKCKHYAYSNVSVPTDFANVAMTFASNVFHAKITAQLTHGNEDVSTLVLDVQGGTRDGTTSSLNIATGTGSVFGNTNTKPWSGVVGTTPTKVILEPSATGTTVYGVDVYIEYKSSSSEGKLESISIGTDTVKSFVY
jgi:hypothetical protein